MKEENHLNVVKDKYGSFKAFPPFFDFLSSPASLKKKTKTKKVNQCLGYPRLNYLEEIQLSIVWLKKDL